jgi:DNA polymerase-1
MQQHYNPGFSELLEDDIKELTAKKTWMENRSFRLLSNMLEVSDYIDQAIKAGVCAVDLETTGLSTRVKKSNGFTVPVNRIVGISLSYNIAVGVYIPINHLEGSELNIPERDVLAELKRLCDNCVTVYHHTKFDLAFLKNYGISVVQYDRFEDTLILARLYDAGQKEIGLKILSDKLLGQPMLEFKDVVRGEDRFDTISPKVSYVYAASDAVCTLGLYEFFIKQQIIQNQMSIYHLEKRLVNVVIQMESNLIALDVPYLQNVKKMIETRQNEIRQEIFKLVGREFNLTSTQQLGRVLFDELGYRYPDSKKTASGQYSTDTATLEKIGEEYPVVKLLIEYRGMEKTLGTYIENLLKNVDEDGYIKLSFNQSGTDTGRFSSPGGRGLLEDGYCGMNVQSLPTSAADDTPKLLKEFPIRKAFKARPGFKIVAMDYSGEELRIVTNLSKETKWMEEFVSGSGDLHTKTGQVIFGKSEITKPERKIAKTVNFLVVYGGGPTALAMKAKISEREGRKIMADFFAGLPMLKRWIDLERARARKLKYSRTAFGRIRPLAMFYDSDDMAQQSHGDRCAVNHEVQGVGADIIKTAMVRVHNWIIKNNHQDNARILITMHDELVFEIRENLLDILIPQFNDIMKLTGILQKIFEWPIPLKLDAEYGDSWEVENNFFKEHPELENVSPVVFSSANQVVPENITAPTSDSTSISPPVLSDSTSVIPVQIASEVPKESSTSVDIESDETFVYTIKDTRKSTVRRLNGIILFLMDEVKSGVAYRGPKGGLKLRDDLGNVFSVSENKVPIDAFLSLARYQGV